MVEERDTESIIALIRDSNAEGGARLTAINAAVEIFAPAAIDDHSRTEDEQRLIDALEVLASDPSEPAGLLDRAGDALGLSWIWKGEFDAPTYSRLTKPARYAARKVVGEEYSEWLPADEV